MKVFDLYGVSLEDGERACCLISQALDIRFNPHVGEFWGEYFLASAEETGRYRLVQNFRGGEWEEEEYKEYPWLFEVNAIQSPDKVFKTLSGFPEVFFLFRTEVEAKKWSRRYIYKDASFVMTHELIL
jgi:hypothetical protein